MADRGDRRHKESTLAEQCVVLSMGVYKSLSTLVFVSMGKYYRLPRSGRTPQREEKARQIFVSQWLKSSVPGGTDCEGSEGLLTVQRLTAHSSCTCQRATV